MLGGGEGEKMKHYAVEMKNGDTWEHHGIHKAKKDAEEDVGVWSKCSGLEFRIVEVTTIRKIIQQKRSAK